MDVFVYSDESGVFDYVHNPYYVFGGVMFLSKEAKDICARKYSKAEKDIRSAVHCPNDEIKASTISNKHKGKLFRSLNQEFRFGVIIDENKINKTVFTEKKHKQRYLDYAYKIMFRRYLEFLIKSGTMSSRDEYHFHFFVDEHNTATDGKYELRESLEQELMYGTFNLNWQVFHPPVFSRKGTVELSFCNSEKVTLVRAADIIANHVYHKAHEQSDFSSRDEHLFVSRLP